MAHLTTGSVSYERRVKTGDFEHKHAAVTVGYAVDEGDSFDVADAIVSKASGMAVNYVHNILRAKLTPVSPGVADPGVPVVDDGPADVGPVVEVEEVPPVTNLKAAKRVASKKFQLDEAPPEIKDEGDELVTLFPEPSLSDAELGQTLSRVVAKLGDKKPLVYSLLGEFVQSGQSFTLIPDVRRAEFVTRLEALS